MRLLTVCVALLAASTSQAESFSLVLPSGVDLTTQQTTSSPDAELVVSDRMLIAKHGVALAVRPEAFHQRAPLALDARYLVRDAKGRVHPIVVHDVRGDVVVLSTEPALGSGPADESMLVGRYHTEHVRIAGQMSEAKFPQLELRPGGTYRLGGVTGRWMYAAGKLSLDGYYADWGVAAVSERLDEVRFRFLRGPIAFEVKLRRSEPKTLISQASVVR